MADGADRGPEVEHVILVIHGIRDYAGWGETVKKVLDSETTRVVVFKYDWYEVGAFLLNGWGGDWAARPADRLTQEWVRIRNNFPRAKVSILAHSFGTYLTVRLLSHPMQPKVARVVLCGAVLKQDQDWEKFRPQVGDGSDLSRFIINHCGDADAWPVRAKALNREYGDAGTNGFGTALVSNIFHKGGHSVFLTESFIRNHFEKNLIAGTITSGNSSPRKCLYLGWLAMPMKDLSWAGGFLVLMVSLMALRGRVPPTLNVAVTPAAVNESKPEQVVVAEDEVEAEEVQLDEIVSALVSGDGDEVQRITNDLVRRKVKFVCQITWASPPAELTYRAIPFDHRGKPTRQVDIELAPGQELRQRYAPRPGPDDKTETVTLVTAEGWFDLRPNGPILLNAKTTFSAEVDVPREK